MTNKQTIEVSRGTVTLEQVLRAYEYANDHPHKYLKGTTNWCAAVAHHLNSHQPAQEVKQQGEAVGWQFYQDGKWWNGDDRIKDHRKNTEDAGYKTRNVYAEQPASADPGEVERIQLLEQSMQHVEDHLSKQVEIAEITIQGLRAKLTARDALLRDQARKLIVLASRMIQEPLRSIASDLADDKPITRIKIDDGYSKAHDSLCEFALVLRQVADAISSSAEPKPATVAVVLPDDLRSTMHSTIRNYRMGTLGDGEGGGYPLIDAMSADGESVAGGIEECQYLADAIFDACAEELIKLNGLKP